MRRLAVKPAFLAIAGDADGASGVRSLDGACGQAAHHLALDECKQDDHRDRRDHRAAEQVLPVDLVLTDIAVKGDRQRRGGYLILNSRTGCHP